MMGPDLTSCGQYVTKNQWMNVFDEWTYWMNEWINAIMNQRLNEIESEEAWEERRNASESSVLRGYNVYVMGTPTNQPTNRRTDMTSHRCARMLI